MICPNKNHPDWKALVSKHGENKAMRIFVENDYQIPSSKKTKRGMVYDALKGFVVSQASTMDSLDSNPKLASDIVNSLKELYPEVKIVRDGLFDKDGNWIEIQPGEEGMHYRNAYISMVAWANDAYLETPPHEYAHHYVDMFRNHPMIAEAIEKYGEERLVEKIGKYYAGEFTNTGFKNWIDRFWNMAKSLFGHPDISYQVFEAFKSNKPLDVKPSQGTAVVRYQKSKTPQTRDSVADITADNSFTVTDNKYTKVDHKNKFKEFFLSNPEKVSTNISEDSKARGAQFIEYLGNKLRGLQDKDKVGGAYRNIAQLDSKILDSVRVDYFEDARLKEPRSVYASALIMGSTEQEAQKMIESFNLNDQELLDVKESHKEMMKVLENIHKREQYMNKTNRKVILEDGTSVSVNEISRTSKSEIESASETRNALYDKLPDNEAGRKVKKFLQWIARVVGKYQLNARLQSKMLSGSESSVISKTLYHAFNKANHMKNKMLQEIDEFFKADTVPSSLRNGSSFYGKNKNLSDYAEKDLYSLSYNGGKVKVTKAEMLSIYMTARQEDGRSYLINNGMFLDDVIEGRVFSKPIKLSEKELANIESEMSKPENAELMEMVTNFDNVFKTIQPYISKTHELETGFPIEDITNYFPIALGQKSDAKRRRLKEIAYLSSGKARLGASKPVRINDAYNVISSSISNTSHYASYAVPIRNARLVVDGIREEYKYDKSRPDYNQIKSYIDALDGNINLLEDSSNLFSSEIEEGFVKRVNKLMNNFTVSVLSLNIPVMMKQPISYLAVKEEMDTKYLAKAGWGIGGLVGIKPKEIMKAIKYTGVKGGESLLPLEWTRDKKNPIYQAILKHSPILAERFEGQIDREMGETLQDAMMADDALTIPGTKKLNQLISGNKDASNYQMSKNRMMEGIKVFDTATVMAIWQAVEYEVQEQQGLSPSDGDIYWEVVANRAETVVNKTQPTFDLNNRSALSSLKNPLARFFTMFSSARSKMAMLLIEGAVDYMNNPTKENKMKYLKRIVNIGVLSAGTLMAVDMIKAILTTPGFGDDDDDYMDLATHKMISNNTGLFFGIGQISDFVTSSLDDKPWHKSIQHPLNTLAEDVGTVLVKTAKGDLGGALSKGVEATFKGTGAPLALFHQTKGVVRKITD